jgi:hypothetical protein
LGRWADGRAYREVAPQGNIVAGRHVSFELENLVALVDLVIKHDGVWGGVEVALSHWVDLVCVAPALVGEGATSLSSVWEATYWAP